jgi:YD repeat-containing protein
MLNALIKKEVKLDGVRVSGTINNFTIDANDQVVPSTTKELKTGQNVFETRSQYQQFDDKERLLQSLGEDGVVSSFLWSYNREHLIVSAKNITYSVLKAAVEAAAGTTDLEAFWVAHASPTQSDLVWKNFNLSLRSNVNLKNAFIITYTASPLLGITSETDPNGEITYYQYDELKRLRYIRNDNGEVVKRFEYVYAN